MTKAEFISTLRADSVLTASASNALMSMVNAAPGSALVIPAQRNVPHSSIRTTDGSGTTTYEQIPQWVATEIAESDYVVEVAPTEEDPYTGYRVIELEDGGQE